VTAIENLKRGAITQCLIPGQAVDRVSLVWIGEYAARAVYGLDAK
jgi:hypothetical protein